MVKFVCEFTLYMPEPYPTHDMWPICSFGHELCDASCGSMVMNSDTWKIMVFYYAIVNGPNLLDKHYRL